MRKVFHAVMAGALLLAATATAQADTFVWKDEKNGYTMSWPDSWLMQTPDTDSTAIRIGGPIGEDLATCRLQVVDDGRLKIYPKRLMTQAVYETLDRDFWDAEVGQFKNAQITEYYAPASLGNQGDATAIQVSFAQDTGAEQMAHMHGVMIGSIYGGKRYVGSCSSRAEVYAKWSDLFMSILDSVQLEARYHPFATGYYRNFLTDPKLALPRIKPGTIDAKAPSRWSGRPYHYNP